MNCDLLGIQPQSCIVTSQYSVNIILVHSDTNGHPRRLHFCHFNPETLVILPFWHDAISRRFYSDCHENLKTY